MILPFPDPPDYLNEEGQEIYQKILKHLVSFKAFEVIDIDMIAMAADWQSKYNRLARQIHDEDRPYVQTFSSGATNLSGYLSALLKLSERVEKNYRLLGIGEEARSRLEIFQNRSNDEKDPFETVGSNLKIAK